MANISESRYAQVIIVAPGSDRIGWGHLVRSLALSDLVPAHVLRTWAALGAADCALPSFVTLDGLARLSTSLHDLVLSIASCIDESGPALVILDDPQADAKLELELRAAGHHVVAVDDLAVRPYAAHAIISHHPNRNPKHYLAEPDTQFFLGPEFALVRAVFRRAMNQPATALPSADALICVGGADPQGLIWRLAALLAHVRPRQTQQLIIGTAQQDKASEGLTRLRLEYPKTNFVPKHMLGAEDLAVSLASAKLVLCSGSTIALEALCVGAKIAVGYYMPDQVSFAQYIGEQQLGGYLGDLSACSPDALLQALDSLDRVAEPKRLVSRHAELVQYFENVFAPYSTQA